MAGHGLVIGVSVGIALLEADQSPEDLLKQADIALYDAKAERGTWRVFTPGMDEHLRHRRALETALTAALQDGGFTLHYQPLLNLAGNRITGFEALLRWRQPDGTLVPPAGFIPVAEQSGLIVAIRAWVLRTACAEAAGWPMRKAAPRRRDTSSARRSRRRRSPAC